MREKYLLECTRIQESSTYTADAHHEKANKSKRLQVWLQSVPAALAAVTAGGAATASDPFWINVFAGIATVSAAISAVASVLDPQKSYTDHLGAAKSFVMLKQDARALRESFSFGMDDNELRQAVMDLHERYNEIVKMVPPTDNRSFAIARKNVQAGIHEPDNP